MSVVFVVSVAASKTSLALVQRNSTWCVCVCVCVCVCSCVCELETLTMRRPRLKMAYKATAKKKKLYIYIIFLYGNEISLLRDRDLYKHLMLLVVELCYAVWYLVLQIHKCSSSNV